MKTKFYGMKIRKKWTHRFGSLTVEDEIVEHVLLKEIEAMQVYSPGERVYIAEIGNVVTVHDFMKDSDGGFRCLTEHIVERLEEIGHQESHEECQRYWKELKEMSESLGLSEDFVRQGGYAEKDGVVYKFDFYGDALDSLGSCCQHRVRDWFNQIFIEEDPTKKEERTKKLSSLARQAVEYNKITLRKVSHAMVHGGMTKEEAIRHLGGMDKKKTWLERMFE